MYPTIIRILFFTVIFNFKKIIILKKLLVKYKEQITLNLIFFSNSQLELLVAVPCLMCNILLLIML